MGVKMVRMAGSRIEASLLAGRLRAEGIRVWTNGEDGASVYAGDGPVSILVQDEDAERADRILEDVAEGTPPEVERSRSAARLAVGSLGWALYVTPPAILLMMMAPWEPARPIGVCVLVALAVGVLGFSLKKLIKG